MCPTGLAERASQMGTAGFGEESVLQPNATALAGRRTLPSGIPCQLSAFPAMVLS